MLAIRESTGHAVHCSIAYSQILQDTPLEVQKDRSVLEGMMVFLFYRRKERVSSATELISIGFKQGEKTFCLVIVSYQYCNSVGLYGVAYGVAYRTE